MGPKKVENLWLPAYVVMGGEPTLQPERETLLVASNSFMVSCF